MRAAALEGEETRTARLSPTTPIPGSGSQFVCYVAVTRKRHVSAKVHPRPDGLSHPRRGRRNDGGATEALALAAVLSSRVEM